MKRKINEHSVNTIMEYFIKGYKFKKNEELIHYEWFIDKGKNQVFIIIYVDKKK